ncbi:hypothetical protein [Methylobacterium fujisawaense]|uniref:hypothetical protein n=1 Tax=Methylobacterium fujisawaense TaxID=107400 RepID=UPI00313C2028
MMSGDDPQDDARGALFRIAQTLGVPVATFLTPDPADIPDIETIGEGANHLAEAVALMRLFVRLKSPEARARCLAYVVQEATHQS